jgi:hypothetical protein
MEMSDSREALKRQGENAMPLQKIKFQTNITVEAALKFAEGKLCDSQFGDPQYMFTTTDDRVFFVAEKVAQKIHGLRLQPQEPFEICKKEVDYGNGRKGIEWQVAKVGFAPGEQSNGTFVVPTAQPGAGAGTPAPVATAVKQPPYNNGNGSKTNGHANGNGNGHAPQPPQDIRATWAQFLLGQTEDLIDVYATASQYASDRHGNSVKAEDVRSLLLSAFINISKNGAGNAV